MDPAQAPKALERAGVPPVGCAFLPIFTPLAVLSLVCTYGSPCAVASPRLVWPLWELGSQEYFCPSVPPMASLSGAIWGTDWAVALSCPGQGGHQFGNLVPQFCDTLPRVSGHGSPSPYFIMGFLILAFCLTGSNHTGNKWS